MGPPSEDGGNATDFDVAAEVKPLQWGRRPRTAEMYPPPFNVFALVALQWGRRPRTAEIGQSEPGAKPLARASMGPPSEDGGNVTDVANRSRPASASMGPPSEDGGNWRNFRRP